jgi:micrococcal nuclease
MKTRTTLFVVLVVLAALAGGLASLRLAPPVTASHGPGWAEVIRYIDGDTVDVRSEDGRVERVRLFGYNAPELSDRCGNEATFALAVHLQAFNDYTNWVYLEDGPRRTDSFGRSLYYAWVVFRGGLYLLDEHMVLSGNALAWRQDGQWRQGIIRAEAVARSNRSGCLWATTGGGGQSDSGQRIGCDPSYPTVCIPPPPPDLDCRDIPHRSFTVLSPDPHRFDGDGDGVGCET